jgi:hypothetical protein
LVKKCIICQTKKAAFCIKGTSNCYCYHCAVEQFGDLGLLVRLENEANKLMHFIQEKINENIEDENYNAIKKRNDDVLIEIKIKKKVEDKSKNKKKYTGKNNIAEKKKINNKPKKPSVKKNPIKKLRKKTSETKKKYD